MVAIVALLVAVGLLIAGWSDGDDAMLAVATGLGSAVVVGLLVDRFIPRRASGSASAPADVGVEQSEDDGDDAQLGSYAAPDPPAQGEPTDADVTNAATPPAGGHGDSVVFIAGRTTFHRPGCSAVAGKVVSRSTRDDLEAGGMTPCRSCLGSPSPRNAG